MQTSRFIPELPIILVWIAVWGIIETLIDRYVKNTFSSRLFTHITLLLTIVVAEYLYDFNGNQKMF